MSSNFVKLTVGVNKSSQQEIYVNPTLIRTIQASPDNTYTVIKSGSHDFMVRLPIEDVMRLFDKE